MKKKVVWALTGLAIACGISFLILNEYYAGSRARQPNPATGEIYPQVAGFSRKAKVYLTSLEFDAFYILMAASIVPALLAGALNAKWKVLAR